MLIIWYTKTFLSDFGFCIKWTALPVVYFYFVLMYEVSFLWAVDGGDIRIDAPETPSRLVSSPLRPDHCVATEPGHYVASETGPTRHRAVIIEGVQHKFMDPILCHLENQIRGRVPWHDYFQDSKKLVIAFDRYEGY